MTIAKRVRDYRYAKGWGPDELASRAEISRTALYQIECGKTETPRAGTLRRIARALDVSIEALLGNVEGRAYHVSSYGPQPAEAYSSPTPGWEQGDAPAAVIDRPAPEPSWEAPRRPSRNRELNARTVQPSREVELQRKFHELLASSMGESVAGIIEESYRLLMVRQGKQTG